MESKLPWGYYIENRRLFRFESAKGAISAEFRHSRAITPILQPKEVNRLAMQCNIILLLLVHTNVSD